MDCLDDLSGTEILLKARSIARIAETLEEAGKFDEALLCHDKAIMVFQKCLEAEKLATHPIVIFLEIQYHQRQKQIVNLNKSRSENRRRLRAEEEIQAMINEKDAYIRETKYRNSEWAIYKNISVARSLIDTLIERKLNANNKKNHNIEKTCNSFVKLTKNDSTALKDLYVLNNRLRELFTEFTESFHDVQKTVKKLKQKVKYYRSLNKQKTESDEEKNSIDLSSIESLSDLSLESE